MTSPGPRNKQLINESLIQKLPTMSPVQQARVDIKLHEAALAEGDRFNTSGEIFLAKDMELKKLVIKAFTQGATPEEIKRIVSGLRNDIRIHNEYLNQMPNPNTGSHEWHRAWIAVYLGWIQQLEGRPPAPPPYRMNWDGKPVRQPRRRLLPPPPPTMSSEWEAFDEQERYNAQPDHGAAVDWTVDQPQLGYTAPVQSGTPSASATPPAAAAPATDSYGNKWDPASGKWISPEGNTYDPNEGVWRSGDGQMVYDERTGVWSPAYGGSASAAQSSSAYAATPEEQQWLGSDYDPGAPAQTAQVAPEAFGLDQPSADVVPDQSVPEAADITAAGAATGIDETLVRDKTTEIIDQIQAEFAQRAEDEGSAFIIAELEAAGYVQTPDGWQIPEDGSEEDFYVRVNSAQIKYQDRIRAEFEEAVRARLVADAAWAEMLNSAPLEPGLTDFNQMAGRNPTYGVQAAQSTAQHREYDLTDAEKELAARAARTLSESGGQFAEWSPFATQTTAFGEWLNSQGPDRLAAEVGRFIARQPFVGMARVQQLVGNESGAEAMMKAADVAGAIGSIAIGVVAPTDPLFWLLEPTPLGIAGDMYRVGTKGFAKGLAARYTASGIGAGVATLAAEELGTGGLGLFGAQLLGGALGAGAFEISLGRFVNPDGTSLGSTGRYSTDQAIAAVNVHMQRYLTGNALADANGTISFISSMVDHGDISQGQAAEIYARIVAKHTDQGFAKGHLELPADLVDNAQLQAYARAALLLDPEKANVWTRTQGVLSTADQAIINTLRGAPVLARDAYYKGASLYASAAARAMFGEPGVPGRVAGIMDMDESAINARAAEVDAELGFYESPTLANLLEPDAVARAGLALDVASTVPIRDLSTTQLETVLRGTANIAEAGVVQRIAAQELAKRKAHGAASSALSGVGESVSREARDPDMFNWDYGGLRDQIRALDQRIGEARANPNNTPEMVQALIAERASLQAQALQADQSVRATHYRTLTDAIVNTERELSNAKRTGLPIGEIQARLDDLKQQRRAENDFARRYQASMRKARGNATDAYMYAFADPETGIVSVKSIVDSQDAISRDARLESTVANAPLGVPRGEATTSRPVLTLEERLVLASVYLAHKSGHLDNTLRRDLGDHRLDLSTLEAIGKGLREDPFGKGLNLPIQAKHVSPDFIATLKSAGTKLEAMAQKRMAQRASAGDAPAGVKTVEKSISGPLRDKLAFAPFMRKPLVEMDDSELRRLESAINTWKKNDRLNKNEVAELNKLLGDTRQRRTDLAAEEFRRKTREDVSPLQESLTQEPDAATRSPDGEADAAVRGLRQADVEAQGRLREGSLAPEGSYPRNAQAARNARLGILADQMTRLHDEAAARTAGREAEVAERLAAEDAVTAREEFEQLQVDRAQIDQEDPLPHPLAPDSTPATARRWTERHTARAEEDAMFLSDSHQWLGEEADFARQVGQAYRAMAIKAIQGQDPASITIAHAFFSRFDPDGDLTARLTELNRQLNPAEQGQYVEPIGPEPFTPRWWGDSPEMQAAYNWRKATGQLTERDLEWEARQISETKQAAAELVEAFAENPAPTPPLGSRLPGGVRESLAASDQGAEALRLLDGPIGDLLDNEANLTTIFEALAAAGWHGDVTNDIIQQLANAAAAAKVNDQVNNLLLQAYKKAGFKVGDESPRFFDANEDQWVKTLTQVIDNFAAGGVRDTQAVIVNGHSTRVRVADLPHGRHGAQFTLHFVDTGGLYQGNVKQLAHLVVTHQGRPVGAAGAVPPAAGGPVGRGARGAAGGGKPPVHRRGSPSAARGKPQTTPDPFMKSILGQHATVLSHTNKPMSLTELLRSWTGKQLKKIPALRGVGSAEFFATRNDTMAILSRVLEMKSSSRYVANYMHQVTSVGFARAGVRHVGDGVIDIGLNQKISVDELLNNTGAYTLNPQLKEVVDELKRVFKEYDDYIAKRWKLDATTITRELGILPGEVIPHRIRTSTGKVSHWTRNRYERLEGKGSPVYHDRPEMAVAGALYARANLIDELWFKEASDIVRDRKTGETLGDLRSQETVAKKYLETVQHALPPEASRTAAERKALADAVRAHEEAAAHVKRVEDWANSKGPRFLSQVDSLNGNIRAMNATLDMSFLGVNGFIGFFANTEAYAKSLAMSMSHFGDFAGAWTESARWDFLQRHRQALDIGSKHGLFFAGSNEFGEFGAGAMLQKLGVANFRPFQWGNETMADWGNAFRIIGMQQVLDAQALLKASDPSFQFSGRQLSDYAQMINKMTGHVSAQQGGNAVMNFATNFLLFAPRFFRSQLGLIADAFTKDLSPGSVGRLVPLRNSTDSLFRGRGPGRTPILSPGDMARNGLATMAILGVAGTIAANEALGNDHDYLNPWIKGEDGDWKVNPNFMTIRYKGRDHKVFGSWDTLFRLGSMMVAIPVNTIDDAINGRRFELPADLLAWNKALLQFKGAPLLKAAFEMLGGFDSNFNSWRGWHKNNKFGLDLPGWTDTMMDGLTRLLPFNVNAALHGQNIVDLGLNFMGLKASEMTPGEKRAEARAVLLNQTIAALRAKYPNLSDETIKAMANAEVRNSPEGRAVDLEYYKTEAEKGRDWAQRYVEMNEAKANRVKAQEQHDQVLKDWWAGGGEQRFKDRQQAISDLEAVLIEIYGSRDKMEAAIDAQRARAEGASAAIPGAQAAQQAASADFKTIQWQIDMTKLELEAARARATLAGRKWADDPTVRMVNDQLTALYARLDAAGDASRAVSAANQPVYDLAKDAWAKLDQLKAEANAASAAQGPELQRVLDTLRFLRSQQSAEEANVNTWVRSIQDTNTAERAALNQIDQQFADVLALYADNPPNDKAGEIYQAANAIFNAKDAEGNLLYKDAQGKVFPHAWDEINMRLAELRAGLDQDSKVLYDFLMQPDEPAGLMAEYRAAQRATDPEAGLFYGKDVRTYKPEQSIYSAAMLAVPGVTGDQLRAQQDASGQEIGTVNEDFLFQSVTRANDTLQAAAQAVYDGNIQDAVDIIAYIAAQSGADPVKLTGDFRNYVAADANYKALGPDISDQRYDVTVTAVLEAVAKLGGPPAEGQPDLRQIGADIYALVSADRAAGEAIANSGTPQPDYLGAVKTGSPAPNSLGTMSAATEKTVLDYFIDIVHERFFGKRVDYKTGQVITDGTSSMAPLRRETYQYLYDRNLDNEVKLVAHAKEILAQHKDNPQIKLLLLSDPAVRLAFNGDPNAPIPPASRNYIIAIDKVLRALDGEEVTTREEALVGYKDVVGDRFFSLYNASQTPAIQKLDEQIDALYNDARVNQLSQQITLIDIALRELDPKTRLGYITAGEAAAEKIRLEQERAALLNQKTEIISLNNARLAELKAERGILVNTKPLPPGDEVLAYLLDQNAGDKASIQASLNGLLEANRTDPRVQALLNFASGKGPAPPELDVWMTERASQLMSANTNLQALGQPVLTAEQINAQVLKEVKDVYVLGIPAGPTSPTTSRLIVAGSAVLAVLGGQYQTGTPQAGSASSTSFGSNDRRTTDGAGFSGTSTGTSASRPFPSVGQQAFAPTPRQGTPMPQPSTGAGRSIQNVQQTVDREAGEAQQRGQAFSLAGQSWPRFKQSALTLFDDGHLIRVLERAFGAGRAITDAQALRQLRVLWKLVPLGEARSFDAWLAELRLLYGGIQVNGRFRPMQQREIITQFNRR